MVSIGPSTAAMMTLATESTTATRLMRSLQSTVRSGAPTERPTELTTGREWRLMSWKRKEGTKGKESYFPFLHHKSVLNSNKVTQEHYSRVF